MNGARMSIGRLLFGTLVVLGLAATPALAHHSFAMFDFSRLVTFRGTVTEFQWTNPHVVLWVTSEVNQIKEVKDGSGGRGGAVAGKEVEKPQLWSVELTSPGNLTRIGWSKRSFSAGDRVELDIHPLRDGRHGGAFKKATILATGQVLTSDLRQQEKPGLP
jgi:hypothetical protein